METKCDTNQTCSGRPNMRPGCNRPAMRPCKNRPCNRPPMRPTCGRPNMCPGMGSDNTKPCDRPDNRPCCSGQLPDGWRPSDGMRADSISEEGELHSEWNCCNKKINLSDGNSMTMGCEGQTMSGCHMYDSMERLGDAFPPVMAYVPWQQWGDTYEPKCGLREGTIFKDLNYIFCGKRC